MNNNPQTTNCMTSGLKKRIDEIIGVTPEQAFVDGAKFWEFHKTGATMWQSDQNLCLEQAKKKYGVADDR